jgi:hypothetical protein
VVIQCGQQAADQIGGNQGACAVVDQHTGDAQTYQRLKRVAHRLVARRAAVNKMKLRAKGSSFCMIFGVNYQNCSVHQPGEGRDAMRQNRLACQHLPLLWDIPPGAEPASCGDDDGGCCHDCLFFTVLVLRHAHLDGNLIGKLAVFAYILCNACFSDEICCS